MSRESRLLAGILLVVLPSVMYGGLALLMALTHGVPGYADNPLRHDFWRAGHAHAGVYLILSLVMLRYVDEAALSPFWKWIARSGAPIAAILDSRRVLPVGRLTDGDRAERVDQSRVHRRAVSRGRRVSLGVGLIRAAGAGVTTRDVRR